MSRGRLVRSRRGAVLTLVAVSLVALLAIMSLAIDMGMAYSADSEAQRVADAAALAGASAFLDYFPPYAALNPARTRAQEYITSNDMLGIGVDTADAVIEVNPTLQRVRVLVQRAQIPTWFARIFGLRVIDVNADATAEAVNAGAAKCVRPWAVQDMWHEAGPLGEVPAGAGDRFGDE